MALTDAARIKEFGSLLGMPLQYDSDESLTTTEVWIYSTESKVDSEINAQNLCADPENDARMNMIAGNWHVGYMSNPNLIDSADVWSEITE
jgi:hypothetical protein